MPMWWWPEGGGWVAWLLMSLSMLTFWGLVIAAVVALIRSGRPATERRDESVERDPERILAERYAEGLIDDEEYERRLARLRQGSSPGQRA